MQTNNTPLPDAGELTRQLIRQPTTLQAFRLPVASLDEAYRLLYASYSAEVIVRGAGGGRPMQPDAGTTQAVAQVARALWPGGKRPGLMLCGTVGNGKTTMLRAIQRACNWLWESGRIPPDMAAHDLDKVVVLTAKEFDLLVLFLKNQGIALYRQTLYERVWQDPFEGDTRTVDLHVQRLRRKLGLEGRLVAVYKVGYRLLKEEET